MADTDHIAIDQLGPDDAAAGLVLSTEAHWNQNEADWRFFLTKGIVFGVRDNDRRLVGSAALLPYGPENAWISMVLVTASWRRRGLATRLVDTCLNVATKQGLTCWLDATPAGAGVYGPLGFTPTLQLRRLRLENSTLPKSEAPALLPVGELAQLTARDFSAMGFDRGTLLAEFAGRPGSRLLSSAGAVALVRAGRTADHIGPLFANGAKPALAMVNAIVRSATGPLLIDAVSTQEEFLQGLVGSGWKIERPFQRMRFGRATAKPAELPFAVAGPEFG
jgi:GNAT superfamily N-acetyltransferase